MIREPREIDRILVLRLIARLRLLADTRILIPGLTQELAKLEAEFQYCNRISSFVSVLVSPQEVAGLKMYLKSFRSSVSLVGLLGSDSPIDMLYELERITKGTERHLFIPLPGVPSDKALLILGIHTQDYDVDALMKAVF